ncbi:MAG: nickel-dependent hydrogenase large subunit [Pseudomonadota bacterium]
MGRRVMGPFNRVEGDLEVHLDIQGDSVESAWVVSPLYRGFEQILRGKKPQDALVYTPRICGICSVAQSAAAAAALADLQGVGVARNGRLATNLVLASENVADHLTHFYLFFMPDFAREVYAGEPWFTEAAARFKAQTGSASAQFLPARAEFLHLMGVLAGKWPHSLAIQPGGTTRGLELRDLTRIKTLLFSFRRFLETHLFGDSLETVCSLRNVEDLESWRNARSPLSCDFGHFLHLAESLDLSTMGRACDRYLSYGVYPQDNGHLFNPGVWHDGVTAVFDPAWIREDLTSSWIAHREEPRHPFNGITEPEADAPDGYTWCKAPRLAGDVVEVGALARQVVHGNSLLRELVSQSGGNVRARVIARLLEAARVLQEMERWVDEIEPGEPFCSHGDMPEDGRGFGTIEAARGSLGHWLQVEQGQIQNYQIVSPTTWNFSPRDGAEIPGALEQALVGAPVREGEVDPIAVQHIVRSFDPCMVCTVH